MPLPDLDTNISCFSGLVLDESSNGPVSHLNPKDIALWTHSIPAPDLSEEAVQSIDWTESFMVRPAGDDTFSSSSMDDSAYVSLPDAQRRQAKSTESQYQYMPETAFVESEPQMVQGMFSPSASAVSYHAQTDTSGFMLPPASDGSISGDLGNLALSQGTLWQMQASTAQTATTMSYPQAIQSPAVVRRTSAFGQGIRGPVNMISQDGMQMNITPQIPYMPSQSPELAAGPVGVPSRTSSRATMSGYASGSSGTAQQTPFTSAQNSASIPMLRHLSSGLSSTHYFDAASGMSPTSPVPGVEHTSPGIGFQIPEDYSEYINLDQSGMVEETPSDALAIDDDIKDEADTDELRSLRAAVDENARSDPLYSANPDKDNYYHCPFLEKEHCDHKPTRLKCNYDKYIDSHLRPFRCKERDCVDVPFSSTACLLRHQREAHGMHGHGQKPHLCYFPDCERSKDGQGFPRKYNLFDHMKRVHNYTGSINDDDRHAKRSTSGLARRRTAPTGTPTEPVRAGRIEKKGRVSKAEVEAQAAHAAQVRRQKMVHQLNQRWSQRKDSLLQKLQNMRPEDAVSLEQVKEDVAAMERIAANLGEMG